MHSIRKRFALFLSVLTLVVASVAMALSPASAQAPTPEAPPQPVQVAEFTPVITNPCSTNGDKQTCLEPATRPSQAAEGPAQVSENPVPKRQPPLWCARNTTSFALQRKDACASAQYVLVVWLIDTRTGDRIKILGENNFSIVHYVFTDHTRPQWDNQLQIWSSDAWGDGVNYSMSGISSCPGACKSVSGSIIPLTKMVPLVRHTGQAVNTTTVGYNQQSETASTWSLAFPYPGIANPVGISFTTPKVRCDWNVLPTSFPRGNIGCVFPTFTPTHLVPPIGDTFEANRHIKHAQASGLPGSAPSGTPLHRLSSVLFHDLNRNKACPPSWTRPVVSPPVSCDEYPYASTVEGAYTGNGGMNQPRSWEFCYLFPGIGPGTGPVGYSVCYINEAHNSQDGSNLSAFFTKDRVLPQEAFFVSAP